MAWSNEDIDRTSNYIMLNESKLTAIILKKQPFNEADEIITLFTKEQGKVRVLAKSIKLSKSKLQSRLQMLFLVNVILAGKSSLPKIISCEVVEVFENLRQNLAAVKLAFLASELVIKFTADEQKNQQLFESLNSFLNCLNNPLEELNFQFALAKFKLETLNSVGLGIHSTVSENINQPIYFSPASGGFSQTKTGLGVLVTPLVYQAFLNLYVNGYNFKNNAVDELNRLFTSFIEYQLERKIKSEKFLEKA
jgi:DNA repair protein RecO (recombination protein O)